MPALYSHLPFCVDPWLTRKSSTCPLCKFECKTAQSEDDSEDMNSIVTPPAVVLTNDRLMEFIMGPQWVAVTTQYQPGSGRLGRARNYLRRTSDRVRSRLPGTRSTTAPEAQVAANPSAGQTSNGVSGDDGDVPLQLITPQGIVMPSPSTPAADSLPSATDQHTVIVSIPPPLDEVRPTFRATGDDPSRC